MVGEPVDGFEHDDPRVVPSPVPGLPFGVGHDAWGRGGHVGVAVVAGGAVAVVVQGGAVLLNRSSYARRATGSSSWPRRVASLPEKSSSFLQRPVITSQNDRGRPYGETPAMSPKRLAVYICDRRALSGGASCSCLKNAPIASSRSSSS